MFKQISKFIVENKRWFWVTACGLLGAAFGAAASDERVSNAMAHAMDDIHITVGPAPTPAPIKQSSGDVDYAHMSYYGRLALADKQNHELEMAKLKTFAEKEAPKDE